MKKFEELMNVSNEITNISIDEAKEIFVISLETFINSSNFFILIPSNLLVRLTRIS